MRDFDAYGAEEPEGRELFGKSGMQGCTTLPYNSKYVTKVYFGGDAADQVRREYELTRVLRDIDPEQLRFVGIDTYKINQLQNFSPEIQRHILRCADIGRTDVVAVSRQTRVQQINYAAKNLNFIEAYLPYLRESLEMLHTRNIQHNDISPFNIGFRCGRLVLIDWGSATRDHSTNSDLAKLNTDRGSGLIATTNNEIERAQRGRAVPPNNDFVENCPMGVAAAPEFFAPGRGRAGSYDDSMAFGAAGGGSGGGGGSSGGGAAARPPGPRALGPPLRRRENIENERKKTRY